MVKHINNLNSSDFSPLLEKLDVEGRINVLNVLLAYQYYKLMKSDESFPDQQLKKYKDKILLERLRLPGRKREEVLMP